MKRILLTLFIMLLASVCSYSDVQRTQDTAYQGTPLSVTQLGPKRSGARWSFMDVSGIGNRLRMVIRDDDTWRETWKQIHYGGSPELPPLPEVDFSREMIILVALGGRPTGSYGIIIEGAYERADRLEVLVRSVSPGKDCVVTQMITAPIDIVRLPKTSQSVSFRETEIVHECK